MNRNRWITLVLSTLVLSAVALPAFDRSLDAQDKKAVPENKRTTTDADNPFAGKVLLIQKRNDSSPSVIHSPQVIMGVLGFLVEKASIKEVAGIRMFTGQGIERLNGKPVLAHVSLPLAEIGAILEFDSVEAYQQFEVQHTEQMENAVKGPMHGPNGPVDPADSP